jgi:hypothetical protein
MKQTTRAVLDNRSRQLNPRDVRYQESRGASPSKAGGPPLSEPDQGGSMADDGRGAQGSQR